ncbi:6-phospho-beta-glucosidase [Paenibacillus sp. FSL E2-8871]|uniref:6-phospho-beta-glucosidase n=1 Tax=Paenibacillus odorifer TaxID=189426 RepID=A0A1R0ZKA7_9BACL|nr:6-phospho-beta-glucosidase [Paenibacillus odorifer]OMD52626.1 6-phospho-beta-glucosidase [Paenibacillus odorifer]OME72057.1 6-phospho-beta-glucosidase [Paenibacillus odorifer]
MKKSHLKIAVIGGGSSYTPELVEGLIRYHEVFPVTELYLADIEQGAEKLRIIGELAQRMINASGKLITLYTTLDRREAIRDADFVATQIRVGMLDARSRDEKIPLSHQLIGQETTGAGGFAKALRTIPVILGICRDIEELAPNAFMINFTNPAGIITEAVSKYSKVKSVGLCNLPIGTKMQIAELYGVEQTRMFIEIVGINHLNWTTRVVLDGDDVTEDFMTRLGSIGQSSPANIPDLEWDAEFIHSVGALPCAYHRYYYMKEEMYGEMLEYYQATGKTRADDVKEVEAELFELYKQPELHEKPAQLEKRGGAYYSEAAVQLMKSIYNDTGDIQTVNVRNQGAIPCLPDDVSIEINCVIKSDGPHALGLVKPLPPQIRGLLQVVKSYEELTIEAAVKGDYASALQALTLHPLVGDERIAKAVLADILEQNADFLPQFQR